MRTPTLPALLLTVLLLPVSAAGATAAAPAGSTSATTDPFLCWFAPRPGSGWTTTNRGFSTCAQCETVGAAGVSGGDRDAYRCVFVPIGLDGDYFLFLPDGTRRTAAPDPYVDALAPANEPQVDNAADPVGGGRCLGQGQMAMIDSTGVTTVKNPSSAPYRYPKILTGVHRVAFGSMRAAESAP